MVRNWGHNPSWCHHVPSMVVHDGHTMNVCFLVWEGYCGNKIVNSEPCHTGLVGLHPSWVNVIHHHQWYKTALNNHRGISQCDCSPLVIFGFPWHCCPVELPGNPGPKLCHTCNCHARRHRAAWLQTSHGDGISGSNLGSNGGFTND